LGDVAELPQSLFLLPEAWRAGHWHYRAFTLREWIADE